jgi:hypothetical protein
MILNINQIIYVLNYVVLLQNIPLYTGFIFPFMVAKYQKGTIINNTVINPKK